ncbi:signal peptidase II [Halothiobacillus neapolitanus]|uniref:Lipoprotein signal peptidase n=1 Tax=Halothiobacillus neapolitanus (strain ATCC 23641 / DSM 15147 / CIP 104769 / NCIMB 8539 / c2) TaxID=555778 RepID=D0KWE3_HALNC|nr:signal peptidase II [Halothiobacillus neapolitanus]ACX97046.1 lipoprotein signal peptidase [Halothiobacillus neapolitanus c2]TDN59737.1 signal peptidase II [Halothiobacillus neapolitanus]
MNMQVKLGQFYWQNLNWLWLSLLVVGLDAGTKWVASHFLQYATPVELTGFFNLTLLHNHGAAFSFLANADGWQRWGFAVLAFIVALGLMAWLLRIPRALPGVAVRPGVGVVKVAIALIIGGAVGNLIDRLTLGYVVDFLDFHWHAYHWPAFNVADSAIVVGVVLLILFELRPNPEKPNSDKLSNGPSSV